MQPEIWFSDALQSPEVIGLARRLEKGESLSLNGIAEAAKPFMIDLLAAATGRAICVAASSVKQQEFLYSEMMALAPFLGASRGALEILYFPELGPIDSSEALPDLELRADVLNALQSFQRKKGIPIVVATLKAASQMIPSPHALQTHAHAIHTGDPRVLEEFIKDLIAWGYEPESQISERGQFSRRGGIVDIFPFQGETPVRLEFNGDEIESMRLFDVETQASVQPVEAIELTSAHVFSSEEDVSCLKDYLPPDHLFWKEPSRMDFAVEVGSANSASNSLDANLQEVSIDIFGHEFLANPSLDPVLQEQRRDLLARHGRDWVREGYRFLIACNNDGEQRRLREWMGQNGWDDAGSRAQICWIQTPSLRGWIWPSAKKVMLSDAEIFGRYQTLRMRRLEQKTARARAKREALDFSQFDEGDWVVHAQHGIGLFLGIRKIVVGKTEQEALTLEYRGGALLHVPLEQAHRVGRYVGIGKATPSLDELGSVRWGKAAVQAQEAIIDYAKALLKIEAERKSLKGFACAPDHEWQDEFEDSFLFKETPDQLKAIAETKGDMESDKPMDRLICGDVGFGKTEVAIRAAFKAVMNGKQVAVLAPTTVLAQQHEHTFRERMADYPVRIDLVSRFRTKGRQRKTLAAAREGSVDILIGTHRLLQPDVAFKDLGLVVVDEEQRFGVKHKERFKEVFKLVDVLTLSATPIPRTLYLSLVGAKDISTIETPPPNRLPVETIIAAHDERLIRSAIERELARGGQVYFLHNRVHSIQRVRDRIVELVPHAKVEIGHGQMDAEDLEEVMMRFVAGEMDVLVATTIIESGLDIPRANTIIIDRADRFGLADLYQLRGRVGRGQLKAYAYLLLPRHLMIEAQARKRVGAIKQYSQLGAGFKVAMRDLEIRGAGNILGTEQSGHAGAIGFDLYCRLLKETLARLKGERPPLKIDVRIRLDFLPVSEDYATDGVGAFVPRAYMAENRQRISAYRRLAEVGGEEELERLFQDWSDRFGKAPPPVRRLIGLAKIRLLAAARGISSIEVEEGKLMMMKGGQYIMDGGRFPRLETSRGIDARLKEIGRRITLEKPKA